MKQDIHRRLHEAKGRKLRFEAARTRLASARGDHKNLQKRVSRLEERLRREKRDVRRLERMGLPSFYHSLMGTKDKRLRKERQEVVEARLKLDAAREELDFLESEMLGLAKETEFLKDAEEDYQAALAEKARILRSTGGPRARELAGLAERRAEHEGSIRELQEAEAAAHRAAAALKQVLAHLDDAANWGAWDMMGGGWITTSIKHGHLDRASAAARTAQIAMRKFARELSDVGISGRLNIRLDEFSKFADYFFDGFVVDWMVQSKIKKSRDRVVRTQGKVAGIRSKLATRLRDRRAKRDDILARRRAILEKA